MNAQATIRACGAQPPALDLGTVSNDVPSELPIDPKRRLRATQPVDDVALISLYEVAQLLGERLPAIEPFIAEKYTVKRLRRRQCLQRAGERFSTIFIVQSGVLMASVSNLEGAEQVLAFPMRGDVVGLDGIGEGRVVIDTVALDSSRVVAMVFAQLADLSREHACVQRMVYRLFGRELTRERGMLRVLGSFSADARVANFLLDLSERHARLGESPSHFVLPMRRQDMARYLGLQLETVSRAMSSLGQIGVVAVEGKRVSIRDWESLRRIGDCSARHIRHVS